MGAAGWHICLDVLDHFLEGHPIGRIVGGDAMKFEGWQRLHAEYAKQFGVEAPSWRPTPRTAEATKDEPHGSSADAANVLWSLGMRP